ncbi:hypothetical protein LguiA_029136 [Lonicera macranthoides]
MSINNIPEFEHNPTAQTSDIHKTTQYKHAVQNITYGNSPTSRIKLYQLAES